MCIKIEYKATFPIFQAMIGTAGCKDELISDILLKTTTQRFTSIGQLTKTYIQLFCADTECPHEDLTRAMVDRDG